MKNGYKFLFILFIIIVFAGLSTLNINSQKLNIVGSTSVQPICEELAGEYKKTHSNIDINVQGGGSSLGIKCANNSISDIGMASCDVDNLKTYEIGREAIVIVVNPSNHVNDLSKSQIKDIFSGKVTNWKNITNESGNINVIVREEGSGTLDVFKEIIMGDANIKKDAIVQNSAGSVKKIIEKDKNAIGFVSLVHLDENLKELSIDGISPSEDSIIDGDYSLQRPFLFITNSTPNNQTMDFINWCLSDNSSKILDSERIIRDG